MNKKLNQEERKELYEKAERACKDGDFDTVKACVEIDPSIVNYDDTVYHSEAKVKVWKVYSLLGTAVWENLTEELAVWLLEQGADPAGNKYAFSGAVICNAPKVLESIITASDLETEQLSYHLQCAARGKAHDSLRVLLDHEADPNFRLPFGECDGMGWRGIWHRSETPGQCQPIWSKPSRGKYRDFEIVLHGLPAVGGVNTIEATVDTSVLKDVRSMGFSIGELEENLRFAQGLWVGIEIDPKSGQLKTASPAVTNGAAFAR